MSNAGNGRWLEWAQVDVFAERALQGNMLAIFPDATGLSTEQMQALARETNLSETTFILPADAATEQRDGIRVRIFTVEEELPFAGHPTLGTASWLYWNHPVQRGAETIRLHLNVGPVPVRFSPNDARPGVFGEMRQRDPMFGAAADRGLCAEALGLTTAGLHPTLAPEVVDTGMPILIVPLQSVEAARRMAMSARPMRDLLAATRSKFVYAVAPASEDAHWQARMQFYGGEDPATGSAAGCAISYLVRHNAAASGQAITLSQGEYIHRPSRLHVRATRIGDEVRDVFVGGRTIPVAMGRFFIS